MIVTQQPYAWSAEVADRDSSTYPQGPLAKEWRVEIRDRLNVILGFAELLSSDPTLTPGNRRFAENIRAAGIRLLCTLEQNQPLAPARSKTVGKAS